MQQKCCKVRTQEMKTKDLCRILNYKRSVEEIGLQNTRQRIMKRKKEEETMRFDESKNRSIVNLHQLSITLLLECYFTNLNRGYKFLFIKNYNPRMELESMTPQNTLDINDPFLSSLLFSLFLSSCHLESYSMKSKLLSEKNHY